MSECRKDGRSLPPNCGAEFGVFRAFRLQCWHCNPPIQLQRSSSGRLDAHMTDFVPVQPNSASISSIATGTSALTHTQPASQTTQMLVIVSTSRGVCGQISEQRRRIYPRSPISWRTDSASNRTGQKLRISVYENHSRYFGSTWIFCICFGTVGW